MGQFTAEVAVSDLAARDPRGARDGDARARMLSRSASPEALGHQIWAGVECSYRPEHFR